MHTSSKLLAPLAATAVLLLSACGGSLKDAGSAPETGTTSSAASTSAAATTAAATTAAPETSTPETTAPETTEAAPTPEQTTAEASPAPTTEAPSPEATSAPAADTAIAAPGTNCGPNSDVTDVYVSGGPVSCAEALAVVNKYKTVPVDSHSIEFVAEFDGYTCLTDRSMAGSAGIVGSRSQLCTNEAGAYIEVRPQGLRVIPGPVAEPHGYISIISSDTPEVLLATPDTSVMCFGEYDDKSIRCFSSYQGSTTVTLHDHGAPTVDNTSVYNPNLREEYGFGKKTVDAGTTLTVLDISCQPQDNSTMRCVNPEGGFTLSSTGVTTE